MSNSHPSTTANSSTNFQLILSNTLKAYEKRTKIDLLAHPLAAELQDCNSPSAILAVLHRQVQGLGRSPNSDDRWTKWLNPTVNVLHALSHSLGEAVTLVSFMIRILCEVCGPTFTLQVFSPGKVIFAGVGLLLSVSILLNNIHGSS